jgi:hypothetical protein
MKSSVLYTLCIGLTTQRGEAVPQSSIEGLKAAVAHIFGGATISECSGVYTHEDGRLVQEKSLKVEILLEGNSSDEAKIRGFTEAIKSLFDQEAILVYKTKVKSEFI